MEPPSVAAIGPFRMTKARIVDAINWLANDRAYGIRALPVGQADANLAGLLTDSWGDDDLLGAVTHGSDNGRVFDAELFLGSRREREWTYACYGDTASGCDSSKGQDTTQAPPTEPATLRDMAMAG